MKSRLFFIWSCMTALFLTTSFVFATTNPVSVSSSGITFPDNSVQTKAAMLPICSPGEVIVNSAGALLCGSIVPVEKGIATCVSNLCTVSGCQKGYSNCDNSADNGCETNLLTSTQNCGACGTRCNPNGLCVSGACTYPPYLISLVPNQQIDVYAGYSTPLVVSLSAPALTVTTVNLFVDSPFIVSVNPQVVIPTGQSQAQFNVTGLAPGTATISATLNDVTVQASVKILNNICLSFNMCNFPPPTNCSQGMLTTFPNPGICTPISEGSAYCEFPPTPTPCPSGQCNGTACL